MTAPKAGSPEAGPADGGCSAPGSLHQKEKEPVPAAAHAPASSSQQDGSQLPASALQQGSKQSGGSGGSLRRARGGGAAHDDAGLMVAGKEVVGRQVAVWNAKLNDWPKAVVAQFNAATQQHLVRYSERRPGEVKHREEWASLARLRFQWLSDPPPGAGANPTYAAAPRGEEAVGWRVKVFWPGMARWYQGRITDYDPKSRKHSVRYRDGDTQELHLRNEAVRYLEREAAAPAQRPKAADARRGGGGGGGGGDKRRAGGGAPPLPGKKAGRGTKRAREGSAGAGAEVSSGNERGGSVARRSKSQRGGGGTPVAAPPTASPPKDAVAGSGEASGVMTGDSEEGGGGGGSQGDPTLSGDAPYSSALDSDEEEEEDGEDDLGSEVFVPGLELEEEEEEEEDSDFEVESVRARRGRKAGGGAPRSGARRGASSRGGSRSARRSGGASRRGRGGVRGASSASRLARRDARGGAPPLRKVLRADEESIKAAGAGIVGARVAVFWHEDESYYKGRLVQFDGYHKRHKVAYDDGEEEWVSLPREAFRWLTPRARSAGCTPQLRHLMQQLGAEECGAPGGGVATRRQAAAGGGGAAPHGDVSAAPPLGEACVGWQVSLLFEGDGQWYRGEVVGWDARRARALLLYDDGEDEWVSLEEERLAWHARLQGHSGVHPGAPRGEAPAGAAALGWRVGVYWPADAAFYCGEVVGWDAGAGVHEVAYDDGERGALTLGADRVKWVLPPGPPLHRQRPGGSADARGRRRGGDESDPDYEAFEYRPRTAVRRPFHRMLPDGLSPAPTPLAGSGGQHAWDLAAGCEAALGSHRHLAPPSAAQPAEAPPQHLGQPVVVRQLGRVAGLACLAGGGAGGVRLPQAITVRVYLSGGGGGAPAAPAAWPPRGPARLHARLRALEAMGRRVARAQQAIVKGVPTAMPSRRQAEEAARAARSEGGGGVTSPTAAQRLAGSSHVSGLHRLARASSAPHSPFHHHRRPHPADSDPSSSSASSDDDGGEAGADSADARGAGRGGAAAGDAMPLSPRSLPQGGKLRPGGGEAGGGGEQQEGSTLSDAMLTSPALGQHSPAILSPFKPAHPSPLGGAPHAALDPALPPLGGGCALPPGPPRSPGLGGGMDALMLHMPPLHLPPLPRDASMAALLPLSRDASGMLAGAGSGLLGLEESGDGSGLLGAGMDLGPLQDDGGAAHAR